MINPPTHAPTSGPAKRAGRGTPADGRESGFTLVELLIVIGIVAVLMSILVLGIRQASDSFALRRAAGTVVSEVRRAQAAAVAERVDYKVEFVLGTPGSLRLSRTKLTTESCPPGMVEISVTQCERVVAASEEWPSSVSIVPDPGPTSLYAVDAVPPCTAPGAGNKCVMFQFLGSPASVGAGTVGTVLLQSRSGVTWSVAIAAATGKVSVQR